MLYETNRHKPTADSTADIASIKNTVTWPIMSSDDMEKCTNAILTPKLINSRDVETTIKFFLLIATPISPIIKIMIATHNK